VRARIGKGYHSIKNKSDFKIKHIYSYFQTPLDPPRHPICDYLNNSNKNNLLERLKYKTIFFKKK